MATLYGEEMPGVVEERRRQCQQPGCQDRFMNSRPKPLRDSAQQPDIQSGEGGKEEGGDPWSSPTNCSTAAGRSATTLNKG